MQPSEPAGPTILDQSGTRWFSDPAFVVDEGDRPFADKLETLLLPITRQKLLKYLPARGHVAEIGVARGKFSKLIIDESAPRYLALVDAWEEQDEAKYANDRNNVDQTKQSRRYNRVRRRFERSGAQTCEVIRGYSHDVVSRFSDEFFDWVYIDANHGFEACLRDLNDWSKKLKPEGFVCGHDFARHSRAAGRFRVVDAVFEFIDRSDFNLVERR